VSLANAKDLDHNAGIRSSGISQFSPIRPTATLNDVVNRDGREILMVDVPVFHCVRLGELTS
jgi:hypothetical protein